MTIKISQIVFSQTKRKTYSKLLLLGVAAIISILLTHGLAFVEEIVILDIQENCISVTGQYIFENQSRFPKLQFITYPFPVDATHPCPVTLYAAWEDSKESHLATPIFAHRAYLALWIPSKSQRTLRMAYTQPCCDYSAQYILTTTKTWRNPLRRAQFSIVPHDVRIVRCNYASSSQRDGKIELDFHKFMPENNLNIVWEEP